MNLNIFNFALLLKSMIVGGATFFVSSYANEPASQLELQPVLSTQAVSEDADDPAIWINRAHPEKSLIIGTDKVFETGGLYTFDLSGKIVQRIESLDRPNNVDVEYDFQLGGKRVDIALTAERGKSRVRAYAIDQATGNLRDVTGNTQVFKGESGDLAAPMGIAIYRNPKTGFIYAIVSRKSGPQNGYLHLYKVLAVKGKISLQFQKSFGRYSGDGEIEAIAVEDQKGWVAYSDEGFGIQVYSIPDIVNKDTKPIATLGTKGYTGDREGLVFIRDNRTGSHLLLSSDQIENASEIEVYSCETWNPNPIKNFRTPSDSTDGIDASTASFGSSFKNGILVMMNSKDKNYLYYDLADVLDLR
jgi:3-phytase